ncbi:MAG: hypothetical protein JNK15_10905, partial [Planctomycetes bacterium]|nr:hypothetical protein [Planctomycetota bacterium]
MTHPISTFRSLALVATALVSQAAAQVVAYHDLGSAAHQANFANLEPQGYRMIALSIYGTTAAPQYAAVWVHRAGPGYVAGHDMTAAQYQVFANTNWALGYRPKVLTAMGTAANPRFACSWELTNAAGWTSHGLTEAQYQAERTLAQGQGLDVTAIDIYGTGADPRYIVAFGPVAVGQHEVISGSVADYQEHFDALGDGHNRPAIVAFNDANRFVSTWRSDDVGDWVAHHDMTSAQYQANFNTYMGQNRYPISVQASGSGAGTRFAAVWAPSDLPLPVVWNAVGPTAPQFAPFDTWVQNWMTANGTRAAQLAIVKDGRLVQA